MAFEQTGELDLLIKQGADWELSMEFTDDAGNVITLTGYKAWIHIRSSAEGPLLDELKSTGASPDIVITGASGLVVATLTYDETAVLPPGKHKWELVLSNGGTPEIRSTPLEGDCVVSAAVVRGTLS